MNQAEKLLLKAAIANMPPDKQAAIRAIADEYLLFVESLVNTHGQELATVAITLGHMEYFENE